MAAQGPLAGRRIVVTRPAAQAAGLAYAIREQGGEPVLLPLLVISDVLDSAPLMAAAQRLHDYDLAIFVSANAIEKALAVILAQRAWPSHVAIAAMGKSSERALAGFGLTDIIAPQTRFDSEALLELPPFHDLTGKKIVIFRGDAGRELMGETLLQRGAHVDFVPCYHRSAPDVPPHVLHDLCASVAAVTLTSSEGLRNLYGLLDDAGRALLTGLPVFLSHERIAQQARALGLQQVIATQAGDDGLLAGLVEFFQAS